MDFLTDLLEKILLNSFDIGSSHWVDITHINNPHSFYVRLTSYRTFMAALQKHTRQINASELQISSLVAFKSAEHGYVRGQIANIRDMDGVIKCDLFAVDNGFLEESVPIEHIKVLQPSNLMAPPLATHCQLADCKPIGETWEERSIEAMKFYIGKERAKIKIRENTSDMLTVEVINTCPDDIATMMALTGYSTLGYGENKISRFSAPKYEKLHFTYKDLKVDDVLNVRVQSGKSLNSFFVAEVKEYKCHLEDRINFSHYCKNQNKVDIENIEKDNPVGIYMDGTSKYERGLVQKVDKIGQKLTVQLMDWGTVVDVHISKIRPMTSSFFFKPVIAIYCETEESQVWDNGLQKFLYPGFEFLITVKKVGQAFITPSVVNVSKLHKK